MATFVRTYRLTLNQYVAIEADTESEACELFSSMEDGDRSWYYLKNEVFDRMEEYLVNNARYVVYDIEPYMEVIHDECYAEDVIDCGRYITEE